MADEEKKKNGKFKKTIRKIGTGIKNILSKKKNKKTEIVKLETKKIKQIPNPGPDIESQLSKYKKKKAMSLSETSKAEASGQYRQKGPDSPKSSPSEKRKTKTKPKFRVEKSYK